MACKMGSHHDKIFNNCPQSPSKSFPFHGSVFFTRRFLSNHPQNVIGCHSQLQRERVGLEFSGWQALQIHVALPFAVELFRFSMGMVKRNDASVGKGQICPEHIDLNIGREQILSVFVNRAFGNLIDSP